MAESDHIVEPFEEAHAVFLAAVAGTASLRDAAAALAALEPYRPKGMYEPEVEQQMDPVERVYATAANCYKMAYDALAAKQPQLAQSYVGVAQIHLDKVRGG